MTTITTFGDHCTHWTARNGSTLFHCVRLALTIEDMRILMFTGKRGVGKTSLAAATGI